MSEQIKCPKGMCPIPAGKFEMRNLNGDRYMHGSRERISVVELPEYNMKRHPVTVGEYKIYLAQKKWARFQAVVKGCGDRAQPKVVGRTKSRSEAAALLPRVDGKRVCGANVEPIVLSMPEARMPELHFAFDHDDHPLVEVNWYEARSYCQFYRMDLPTETQWERGARGLAGDKEFGTLSGKLTEEEAYYRSCSTDSVCSKPANDLGLCDMAGQVWEWTLNWYRPNGPGKYPLERDNSWYKVIRGGSYESRDSYLLSAGRRLYQYVDRRDHKIGFRCAAPQDAPPKGRRAGKK